MEKEASEESRPAAQEHHRRVLWVVFACLTTIYGLTAFDRLAQPSPQFHFVDLAHSWMSGRLDTDTPRQRKGQRKDGDPAGYRRAVERTLDAGGWNDWASLRTLTLSDGTVVRGRFPFGKDLSDRKHIFRCAPSSGLQSPWGGRR